MDIDIGVIANIAATGRGDKAGDPVIFDIGKELDVGFCGQSNREKYFQFIVGGVKQSDNEMVES